MRDFSLKLGSVSGIGIYVHWTFLILLGVIALAQLGAAYTETPSGETVSPPASVVALQMAGAIGFILTLFACVVLHELGHALTAQLYGVQTRDIILLPIGGVARLERIPEKPWQEFWVAIAGPAVNVVIAVVLIGTLAIIGPNMEQIGEQRFYLRFQSSNLGLLVVNFMLKLAAVNIFLVVFNLLPAFPMDGGRILRSLLATRMDRVRATDIAASIGQFMAVIFALVGLLYNPFLMLIALFVWLGAQSEAEQVRTTAILRGISVRDAMQTEFRVLNTDDTLEDAIDALLTGSQQDFPVLEGDRFLGILTRSALFEGLREKERQTPIGPLVERECGTTHENEQVETLFGKMRQGPCSTVPVFRGPQLVGLLTLENIGELISVLAATKEMNQQKMEG